MQSNFDSRESIGTDPEGNRSDNPIVTVLTVVYNAADEIRATVDSVIPFICSDLEYIIIDGGSTDGTYALLQGYSNQLASLVSEPDQGIYDAMNKGLKLAKGRFLLHLNVGDRLMNVPFTKLSAQPAEVACVAGRVRLNESTVFIPFAGWALNFHNTLHHQGCFYARHGMPLYDLRYKVFADFDLNQRLARDGRRIVLADDCVASHAEDGVSNRPGHFSEVYEIVARNRGVFWLLVCWLYFKYCGLHQRISSHAT